MTFVRRRLQTAAAGFRVIGVGLRAVVEDVVYIGGMAAITFGAWQVYAPAGWIAGGLFACVFAYALGRATK